MTSKIGLNSVIAKTENFIETNVDDETVLMHLDDGKFLSVKSTARRIWELLETPQSVAQLCDLLMVEFDVPSDECRDGTLGFVQQLLDRQLIKEC